MLKIRPKSILGIVAILCALTASAAASEKKHGLSTFGDLKYPADFKHFDYVNPDAPKGGRLATIGTASVLTFNSFNPFILRDDPAQGLDFLFDSLMTRAQDEPDAMYGLIAQSAEVADDKRSVTFYLRPEAKFRDGTPVTAEDVVFSFDMLRDPIRAHPSYAAPLRDVAKAEAIDPHTVRYEFRGDNVRDLPRTVAGLPVLSKAAYTNADFYKPSLDPPMGSGPYEIGPYKTGTFITYKRRPDYWAADLPVNRGRFNFDEIRYEYYRDRTAGLEAFKAGAYDLREEFTSKSWATEYKIPQVAQGKIKLATLPDGSPSGAQGWFINMRRGKFADPRVRKALDYAFDFEWCNKNLFYGLYTRTHSFFANSDLEAKGPPSEAELKILEPFREKIPPEVFGEPYVPPVSDGSGRDRRQLAEASKLLTEAGWTVNAARRARQRQGRSAGAGIADGRAEPGEDLRLLRRKAQIGRHPGLDPQYRRGAISGAPEGFRLRSRHVALFARRDARPGNAPLLELGSGGDQGQPQPARHRRSGNRHADRPHVAGRQPRRAAHHRPRARPRAARRPLLGAAMVQGGPHGRVLGPLFLARDQADL